MDRLVDGRDLPIRVGLPSATPNNCRSVCRKTGYRSVSAQPARDIRTTLHGR